MKKIYFSILFIFLLSFFFAKVKQSALDVLPIFEATVFPNGSPVKLKKPLCFLNSTVVLQNANPSGGDLVFYTENPVSWSCSDLLVSLTQKQWKLSFLVTKGKHVYSLKWENEDEWKMVQKIGISIFLIKKKIEEFSQLYELYEAWYKNDPANIKSVIQKHLQFTYESRKQSVISIDEKYIQDGDALAITKFNNQEAGIMMGSGSRSGHSAIFIRDPDTNVLYVIEATPDFGGFHKTEYKEWLRLHSDGTRCEPNSCAAVHMRLKPEFAELFKNNSRKAWDYYKKFEGQPYIYHSNFFAALDNKVGCLPAPLDCEMVSIVLSILDRVYPDTFRNYFMEGLEHRVGKKFQNFVDFTVYVEETLNKTISDIWSIPERDDWLYEGRTCLQCTSLVVRMYKEVHMFDYALKKPIGYTDDKIFAAEFHPRDLYQLGIYDTDPTRKPFECFDGYADSKGYCQVLGNFVVELPFFSTVPPYEHMNEYCPIVYPFDHTQKC